MPDVMARTEAIAAGLKRYFTGKPCPQGHVALRRVCGACVECARLDKLRWRKNNPERVKALKLAEQKRNRASANARNRRWLAANREQSNAATAAWQKANPDKVAARFARRRAAKRQQCPKWADHEAIGLIYRAAEVVRVTGFDVHVDHVVPLQGKSVSGLHVPRNLQILGAQSNRSKANRLEGVAP